MYVGCLFFWRYKMGYIKKLFTSLAVFELCLWLFSVITVTASFLLAGNFNPLTLIASLIGVTSLIFIAKGNVFGQVLMVIFGLVYSIISLQYCYYGEMITYLGMTAPIALMSAVSWYRHPYKNSSEVTVNSLNALHRILLVVLTLLVTVIFYFILKGFDTPNLFFSTVSIATSFAASYLALMRSPVYAVAYAANDLVLIVLWILASMENTSYIPVIICFAIFFINDIYGFVSWRKMKIRQSNDN